MRAAGRLDARSSLVDFVARGLLSVQRRAEEQLELEAARISHELGLLT